MTMWETKRDSTIKKTWRSQTQPSCGNGGFITTTLHREMTRRAYSGKYKQQTALILHTPTYTYRCASGCVVECRICNREVAGSNFSLGYCAPRSTQPSIPPGSVNEYQLRLGRQRQVWLILIADERVGVHVKLRSLENTCHTWALLRWCFTKRRYIECTYLHLFLCNCFAAI